MRPGIWELGLIVVVVLIIFLATRFSRSGKSRDEGSENRADTDKGDASATWTKRSLLNRAGFALIFIGLLLLLLSISVLKWVFWGSIWAVVIAIAGLALILIVRR
jgi:hypothetical protein